VESFIQCGEELAAALKKREITFEVIFYNLFKKNIYRRINFLTEMNRSRGVHNVPMEKA